MLKCAKVAVLLDQSTAEDHWNNGKDVYSMYVSEVLNHAGIHFEVISDTKMLEASNYQIVLAALEKGGDDEIQQLWSFAMAGGIVISYCGLDGVAYRIGYSSIDSIGVGYAMLPRELGSSIPLRFLQGSIWSTNGDAALPQVQEEGALFSGRPDGEPLGAAYVEFAVGKGKMIRWNVDVLGTIVGLQQGTMPVTQDGQPAPDGSAAIDDGVLKADDGFELDWELDRTVTESGAIYIPYAYGDRWRDAIIRQILHSALDQGLTIPFVWYWPEGVDQVALISHDSDRNQEETAVTTLEVLRQASVRSTWCMIEPGFSPEVMKAAANRGHEIALHYNAMEGQRGAWGEAEFHRQLRWLKEAYSLTKVTSNKNHYTCFRGWGELFTWCENAGIELDQTRGPSKRGNVGFLFGTCQPFFPVARADERNRLYNVLEAGFLTQDLNHERLADSSILFPFLEEVKKVNGVAHFLFHQLHIHTQPAVAEALQQLVTEARKQGFQFWTAAEINNWVRARRKWKVTGLDQSGSVTLEGSLPEKQPVVWIPLPEGCEAEAEEVTGIRFGVLCRKANLSQKVKGEVYG